MLGKHKDNLLQVEAMLFGQAGLLKKPHPPTNGVGQAKSLPDGERLSISQKAGADANSSPLGRPGGVYFSSLQNEYKFLRKKYSLQPMDASLWKFLRLRPAAFPTIRISQFANLLCKSSFLFSKIIEFESIAEMQKLFSVSASEFWDRHYTFETHSVSLQKVKDKKKRLGESTINNIIINTVIPFLFVYGKQKGNSLYQERALKFLESLPPEKNSITGKWEQLNFKNNSALISQSLLELKNEYCNSKKCLQCAIGNFILKSSTPS